MEEHLDKNFLVISTLVDPRYKNKGSIFNAAQRMRNKLLICSEIVQCLNPVDPMSPAHSFVNGENNDDPMGQFLSAGCEEEHLTTNMADYPNVEEEVDAYFKASTEKLTIDPTEFWKNSSMYPNIKKLARIYLSCPPSSVESERIFSRLSSIENFKRSRLTSQHAKEQF
uniref:HAT C-terminal dimerisation domain-containing protein n=1 Tax=Meloidogyne incognita TaxID=6306 RepID=A0A914N378_MELIC